MYHRRVASPQRYGILQGSNGQGCRHLLVDQVADDPLREDVLDQADVELALLSRMLGDVGDPQLVGVTCREVPLEEVIVDRWARAAVEATLSRMVQPDPLVGAEPPDAVLRGLQAQALELVGNEAIAELRVVSVGVDGGVGQVGVLPAPCRDRAPEPLEAGLLGDPLGGKVTNQRVLHFRRTSRPK